ncbi:MAG: RNA methyltransferase [Oscillospiraceae bacterium]|nr:RNA methyltransferase [Oscillospiraceae bacterium]
MDIIKSRQNKLIAHLRKLGTDGDYRRRSGEFLCQGVKLYDEARASGAEIRSVIAAPGFEPFPEGAHAVSRELLEYVSPMKNAPELIFSCAVGREKSELRGRLIMLENMQDPGNVGTIMRTARAFGMDGVILAGECADPYNPKSVRASMGAVFSLNIYAAPEGKCPLPLYAAALSDTARTALDFEFPDEYVLAVGNEGHGLSEKLTAEADGIIKIPMESGSESLNAAAAAAVLMWISYSGNLKKTRERTERENG